MFICIYKPFLPEGQTCVRPVSHTRSNAFGNRRIFDAKTLSLFRLNGQCRCHRRLEFFHGPVRVRIVLGKVAQWLSSGSFILQILHKRAHFNITVIGRRRGRRLIILSKKRNVISQSRREVEREVTFSRYRPGVTQRVGRGITLLFHDRGTRRG